ncbi:hypothetical protein SLA2020_038140 [Shorea laevis]
MDFFGPILDVVKFIGPPICKYLKYHQKLNDFVSNFKRLQEDLHNRKDAVESRLHAELHFGKRPNPEVTKWLEDVVEITNDAQQLEDKVRKGKDLSRACLGKLVDEKTQEIKLLFDKGNFLSVVVYDPSSSRVSLPTSELVGEEDVKTEIWSCLEGDQVNKIGVCGMGGIGKTTVMKHVYNELLKKYKLKRVIWATVSKEFDIGKLQKDIASALSEPFDALNITRGSAILLAILERLGPFVLILDDVWASFSLEDVGILEPTTSNGCKLVLTTRSKEVARSMGCKIIEVKPLNKDQALKLFLNKVGDDIFPAPTLESTLKMIVDECAGLPLAIVTVAGSMKGMSDPHLWKNVLNELREQKRMVAGTEVDEFRILKFSYDHLKDEKIQHCFLYCALYPEDHAIQKDEIIEYWIEEGLIDEMQTREAMKHKGHDILWKLEGNCLLEFIKDKYKGECVRMHDLLRDMALHITRTSPRFLVKAGIMSKLTEEHEWKEDILKVSLMYNCIEEIPSSLPSPKCPTLTTLLLSHNFFSAIPEYFFDHMLGLKILDLSYNYCLESLPNSVSRLVNLTALLLRGCIHLRKIPSLCDLRVLKKLDLYDAPIEELPQGIEMLTNLKYLDFSGSYPLSKGWGTLSEIPDGILPNLCKVQYLGSDYKIVLKVEEIKKLAKLESFRGRFLTAHDMNIFYKSRRDGLSWYNLHIGGLKVDRVNFGYFGNMNFIRCYGVDTCGEPSLLPSDVQNLEMVECNDMRSLNDIPGFQDATDLQECKIYGCEGIECFLSSWSNLLPSLRFLELGFLKNLKAMFEVEAIAKSVLPPVTFSSLKLLRVFTCAKMNKLFPPILLLQNLEEIEVKLCLRLEEIMASEPEKESERVSKIILPKLKKLKLTGLPALRNICSSTAVLVCDSIKDLEFGNCLNLNIGCVFGSWFNPLQTLETLTLRRLNLKSVFDEEALSLLFPPTTAFFPLKSLSVTNCHQLKKLFPHTLLLGYLQNLEVIEVLYCEQMEELISLASQEEEKALKLSLPKLTELKLKYLPKLKSICSGNSVLICDSLQSLTIRDCKELKRIPLHLPQLDNAQPNPLLKRIYVSPKECWELLEWNQPNAKDTLSTFCRFDEW